MTSNQKEKNRVFFKPNYGFSLTNPSFGKIFDKLPTVYKNFIQKYNGGKISNNVIELSKNHSISIRKFFSADEILSIVATYKNRLSDVMLPICDVDGGDLICINIKDKIQGIYLWNHEMIGIDEYEVVAHTFIDFIDSFKEEGPLDLIQNTNVISVKILNVALHNQILANQKKENDFEFQLNSDLLKSMD